MLYGLSGYPPPDVLVVYTITYTRVVPRRYKNARLFIVLYSDKRRFLYCYYSVITLSIIITRTKNVPRSNEKSYNFYR